jgi:hypothetical protein
MPCMDKSTYHIYIHLLCHNCHNWILAMPDSARPCQCGLFEKEPWLQWPIGMRLGLKRNERLRLWCASANEQLVVKMPMMKSMTWKNRCTNHWLNKSMNEWANEWIHEPISEWGNQSISEAMSRSMKEVNLWKNQSTTKFLNEYHDSTYQFGNSRMSESMSESMRENADQGNRWTSESLNECMNEAIKWINEVLNQWMNEWINARGSSWKKQWINECFALNWTELNWNWAEQNMTDFELNWKMEWMKRTIGTN